MSAENMNTCDRIYGEGIMQHLTYHPPIVEPKKDNPFVEFIKRIWNVVCDFFKMIKEFFCPSNFDFNDEDRESAELARTHAKALRANHMPPAEQPAIEESPEPSPLLDRDIQLVSTAPQEPPSQPLENPVMDRFHNFNKKLVENILEAVYKKEVAPRLPQDFPKTLQEVSKAIKFAANFVIVLGDRALLPILERFAEYNPKDKVQPELKSGINWLLQNGAKTNLSKNVNERVKGEFVNEEDCQQAVQVCIDWLTKDQLETPLKDYYGEHHPQFSQEQIDRVLEAAILTLAEYKIDKYTKMIEDTLDGRLDQLVHDTIMTNGLKITDIISRRLIDLLENSNFKSLTDDLFGLALHQAQTIAAAEKAKVNAIDKEKKKIARYRKALQKESANSEKESLSKTEAAEKLENIEKIGEEAWLDIVGLKAKREVYLAEPTLCHKNIKTLMYKEQTLTPKKKKELFDESFLQLSTQMMDLLIPKKTFELSDGNIEQVDGLIYLLSQIELPKEFEILLQEAQKICSEIIPPDSILAKLTNFKTEEDFKTIEGLILQFVRGKTYKLIVEGLQKAFDIILKQELFNKMLSEDLLPALREKLLQVLAQSDIANNKGEYQNLLHQLAISDENDQEIRGPIIDEICNKLHGKVKKACSQYHDEFARVTDEQFKENMAPMIQDLEDWIRIVMTKKGSKEEEITKNALDALFNPEGDDFNPVYGELIFKVGLELGEMSDWLGRLGPLSDFVKDKISKEVTLAAKPIVSSPDFLVNKITEKLEANYIKKEGALEELLFGKPQPVNAEEAKRGLDSELEKMSRLTHDCLMQIAPAGIVRSGLKAVIGSDATGLNQAMQRVFEKMLGDSVFNHNLLLRTQEIVLARLQESSSAIKEKNPEGHIVKADKVPTILMDHLFDQPQENLA